MNNRTDRELLRLLDLKLTSIATKIKDLEKELNKYKELYTESLSKIEDLQNRLESPSEN